MPRRIAFIDYFPTHYRRRLYEEIGRRMDADFYFFADERERYWNRNTPLAWEGDYHRVDLRRFRIGGEAVMPGVALPLLRGRYDAVIKSLNGKLQLPITYGAAKAGRTAFVLWTGMWLHPRTPVHRISKPFAEAVYRGSDAIVAYGEHVKRFLLGHRGVEPQKVFVAGQAVDATRFTTIERNLNGDVAEILYVGQFEKRKGLDYLLDAFEALPAGRARLRLVGSGSQEGALRARADGRADVEFVGHRSQEELPAELARARCLVLPSITTVRDREPWGLVCNEAMHAGVPVVTTTTVGAAAGGLVRSGRNGFVVPERNPAALADALRRVVENPQTAAQLGDTARADAAEFTYERMADAFEAAVEYGIAARRRR